MDTVDKLAERFLKKFEEFQPSVKLKDETAFLCSLKLHEVFRVLRDPVFFLLSTNENLEIAFRNEADWLNKFLTRSPFLNQSPNRLLLLVMGGGGNQHRIEELLKDQYLALDATIIPAGTLFVPGTSPKEAIRKAIAQHVPTRYFTPYRIDQIARHPMFIGRKELLNTLQDTRGIHMIVGPRRVGKSSLARFLEESLGNIDRPVGEKKMFKCSYTDVSELGGDANERLWNSILRHFNLERNDFAVHGRMVKLIGATRQDDRAAFIDEAQALANLITTYHGQLTIILDEVDQWIELEAPKWPILGRLKAMTDDGKAQVILVGYESLYLAAKSDQFPFWGRGPTHLLRPLKVYEVEELATKPIEDLGLHFPAKDDVIKLIWLSTSGMPHIVQDICSRIVDQAFKLKSEPTVTAAMTQSAVAAAMTVTDFRDQVMNCPLPLAEAIAGVLSVAGVDPYWVNYRRRMEKAKSSPSLLIKEIAERLEKEGFAYDDRDFRRALTYLEIRFILEPDDDEKTQWKWTNESARETMQNKIQGIDLKRWLQGLLAKYREDSWRTYYKL